MEKSHLSTDEWLLIEKLYLASCVEKLGENWSVVSKQMIKLVKAKKSPRDPEFYSAKNCAEKFTALLATVSSGRPKRGEAATEPVSLLVERLANERVAWIDAELRANVTKYRKLKKEIELIKSGELDHQLPELMEQCKQDSEYQQFLRENMSGTDSELNSTEKPEGSTEIGFLPDENKRDFAFADRTSRALPEDFLPEDLSVDDTTRMALVVKSPVKPPVLYESTEKAMSTPLSPATSIHVPTKLQSPSKFPQSMTLTTNEQQKAQVSKPTPSTQSPKYMGITSSSPEKKQLSVSMNEQKIGGPTVSPVATKTVTSPLKSLSGTHSTFLDASSTMLNQHPTPVFVVGESENEDSLLDQAIPSLATIQAEEATNISEQTPPIDVAALNVSTPFVPATKEPVIVDVKPEPQDNVEVSLSADTIAQKEEPEFLRSTRKRTSGRSVENIVAQIKAGASQDQTPPPPATKRVTRRSRGGTKDSETEAAIAEPSSLLDEKPEPVFVASDLSPSQSAPAPSVEQTSSADAGNVRAGSPPLSSQPRLLLKIKTPPKAVSAATSVVSSEESPATPSTALSRRSRLSSPIVAVPPSDGTTSPAKSDRQTGPATRRRRANSSKGESEDNTLLEAPAVVAEDSTQHLGRRRSMSRPGQNSEVSATSKEAEAQRLRPEGRRRSLLDTPSTKEGPPGETVPQTLQQVTRGSRRDSTHKEKEEANINVIIKDEEQEELKPEDEPKTPRRASARGKTQKLEKPVKETTRGRGRGVTPASECSSRSSPMLPATGLPSHFPDADSYVRWKKGVELVLKTATHSKYAPTFARPVRESHAPGYHRTIKRPMDLSTIRKNLDSGVISTTEEFERDVRLMLVNAIMFNPTGYEIYNHAITVMQEVMPHLEEFKQLQDKGTPGLMEPKLLRHRDRPMHLESAEHSHESSKLSSIDQTPSLSRKRRRVETPSEDVSDDDMRSVSSKQHRPDTPDSDNAPLALSLKKQPQKST